MAQAAKKRSGNTKKQNTAKKGSGKKTVSNKDSANSAVASSIILMIVGLVAAVFLALSNFEILGPVGDALKYVQFGLFGCMGYLFPLLLIIEFIYNTLAKNLKRSVSVFSVIFYLALCVFVHIVSGLSLTKEIVVYFTDGAVDSAGGGIIGGAIAAGLNLAISKTGAIIVIVMLMLFSLFMIFKGPIIQFVRDFRDDVEVEDIGPSANKKKKRRVEPVEDDDEIYNVRIRQKRPKKKLEPVYETEEEDGTVIKIVHTPAKRRQVKRARLVRVRNKANPLRDGTARPVPNDKVGKGIGNNNVSGPANAGGDELHEITNARPKKKKAEPAAPVAEEPKSIIKVTEVEPEEREEEEKDFWELDNAEETIPVTTFEGSRPADIPEEDEGALVMETPSPEPAAKKEPERTVRASLSGTTFSRGEPVRTFEPVTTVRGNNGDNFQLPPLDLLARNKSQSGGNSGIQKTGETLVEVLKTFGVNAELVDTQVGPSVTRFELKPELGTRVSKITSLADDLKLNLAVPEIRIEAPIPGKAAIGIEIPNKNRMTVTLRELLESDAVKSHKSKIAFSAGKDISGNVIVSDLAKMPHMLVAGTTGSGKSVFLNSILMCILYRAKPTEVGLIIVDPKKVEFGVYQGIPHLMKQVVTDPGQAVSTLRWAVGEMTNRYQRMQLSGVRDFKSYNDKFDRNQLSTEEENPKRMQQIVIVIDELADLMMVAAKEVESLICRLAQLARAAGIHLIIATQRPSVDVVTGLIKANIPARVALLVASGVDSRTIIDMIGAEKLLGNGDMLFYPTGYVKPVRVQGAFVSDEEIYRTVKFLINQNNVNYYEKEAAEMEKYDNASTDEGASGDSGSDGDGSQSKYDEYLYEAGKLCIESGKASSSMLQRRFSVGFNRAARIVDQLYEIGAIGPQNGAKPREILVDSMKFEEMCQELGII